MNFNKIFIPIILILFILCLLSCENNKVEPLDDEVFVHHVIISNELSRLKIGEKDTLWASPQNYNGEELDTDITWISDRPDTVTVDQNGVVTAITDGKAQVYAVAGDVKSPFCNVTCYSIHDILLNYDYRTLIPGDTLQLVAMAKDRQGLDVEDAEFTWQSYDPSIASVDENGLITIHGTGITTITAIADDVESVPCRITSVNEMFSLWTKEHNSSVSDVEFHPDGHKVFSGSLDQTLKCWDSETGNILWTGEHDEGVDDIECSLDGFKVATGSRDRFCRTWDTNNGELLWQSYLTTGVEQEVLSVSFAPDGNTLFSLAPWEFINPWDPEGLRYYFSVVKMWHTHQDQDTLSWVDVDRDGGYPTCGIYSPDGSRIGYGNILTSGFLGRVRIRNASNGFYESEYYHGGKVTDLEFSSDGSRVASCGGYSIVVWECNDEVFLWGNYHEGLINQLDWSPDGTKIATVSEDNTLKVWDSEWGDLLWEGHHNKNPLEVIFSPDNTKIATGGKDRHINIWDAETGELLAIGKQEGFVNALSFDPFSSKVISGGSLNEIKMWDISSQ